MNAMTSNENFKKNVLQIESMASSQPSSYGEGILTRVPADLTPDQMLKASGLDWRVYTEPAYATINGNKVGTGHSVLVRETDHKIFDVITDDWKPMQNEDAFAFFNDFIAAGDMEMHTAGSLKDGRYCFALAKVNESFDLFDGKDRVDAFLQFTNPHIYGKSIDVRFTPIRVECWNSLVLSLATQSKNMVRVSHRREFDPELVKEMLGVAKHKLQTYKETAQFLSQKRAKDEDIVDYFKRVFPITSNKGEDKLSKNAKLAIEDIMDSQPGAEFGRGTWWQAANCVSYMVDHVIGRNTDNRLTNAWYGAGKNLKNDALELAVEMAEAS